MAIKLLKLARIALVLGGWGAAAWKVWSTLQPSPTSNRNAAPARPTSTARPIVDVPIDHSSRTAPLQPVLAGMLRDE